MGDCCSKLPPAPLPPPSSVGVEEALKLYYQRKILPVELRHDFAHFHSPPLDAAEFHAKPVVLLVGQYSVGKTSMISYLLGQDYPGSQIGPEPTTDGFVVVSKGNDCRTLLGASLVKDASFPFKSLSHFGPAFLGRLRGALINAPLLEELSFIDTPGILSGETQTARGYPFEDIMHYFANKVDMILLLFDTSKLDIGDEFKRVIECFRGNQEKVKIILNKADSVSPFELIRVRGALMWNLGRILQAPEVPQVFIGSFWGEKLRNRALTKAFYMDYITLIEELRDLPKTVKARKINDMAKRAQQVRIHALIMDTLLQRRCLLLGKERGLERVTRVKSLEEVFHKLRKVHKFNQADIPSPAIFRRKFEECDVEKWTRIKPAEMLLLEEFIVKDITAIIEALPTDKQVKLVNIEALKQKVEDRLQLSGKEEDWFSNKSERLHLWDRFTQTPTPRTDPSQSTSSDDAHTLSTSHSHTCPTTVPSSIVNQPPI